MKSTICRKLIIIALFVLTANYQVISQQVSFVADWKPPEPRTKYWTIFAPKPFKGDNIFKDEADGWLADAIENVEVGYLSPIKDQEITEYISKIGKNLAIYSTKPKKEYEFIVLNKEEPNAMNIGGGRIYINIGMLRKVENEDELIGVLAHEISHDAFAHVAKTVTRQLFWMLGERKVKTAEEAETALRSLLKEYEKKTLAAIGENLLGFQRFDELEADRAAFYNAFKAGYSPRYLGIILKRLKNEDEKESGKPEFIEQIFNVLFGSHPPTSQRIDAISWESNFVKMPKKDEFFQNAAFKAMKAKLKTL
jgi:predicted Zn-dependent protease